MDCYSSIFKTNIEWKQYKYATCIEAVSENLYNPSLFLRQRVFFEAGSIIPKRENGLELQRLAMLMI